MAANIETPPTTKLAIVLFILTTFINISSSSHDHHHHHHHHYFHHQLKETKMSLYFHDFPVGPNATSGAVAGFPGKHWWYFDFGTIYVTDNPITEALDYNSLQIGRAQGIYITSSLDGANSVLLVSIVFANREYNGSTLELQGRSVQMAAVSEVSVVSGTGKFRLARGYATFENVYLDKTTFHSVLRCNITVLH